MTQKNGRTGTADIRLRRRRALSLAEVTASLVIAAILLGAMGGTILVASKSLPQNNQAHSTGQTAALALDTLAEELHCALSFAARSPTAIEFTVPDRTGDAAIDTLRYEWGGTPGDALVRRLNGGDALVAIPALHSLEFAYDVSQRTETQKTTSSIDSPEIVLASFTDFGALLTSPLNLTLSNTQWAAASFSTIGGLPANVSQLRITRAVVYLRRGNSGSGSLSSARVAIGIHSYIGGSSLIDPTPIGTPYQHPVESLGGSYQPITATFSNVVLSNPLQNLALVLRTNNGNEAVLSALTATLAGANGVAAHWTTDSGASWRPTLSLLNQNDIFFTVYGVYRTPNETETSVTRHFVRGVRVRAIAGSAMGKVLSSTALTVNQPEVAGP